MSTTIGEDCIPIDVLVEIFRFFPLCQSLGLETVSKRWQSTLHTMLARHVKVLPSSSRPKSVNHVVYLLNHCTGATVWTVVIDTDTLFVDNLRALENYNNQITIDTHLRLEDTEKVLSVCPQRLVGGRVDVWGATNAGTEERDLGAIKQAVNLRVLCYNSHFFRRPFEPSMAVPPSVRDLSIDYMKLDANVHPNLSDALRNLTRLQLENVAVRLDSFKEMAAGPFVLMDNLNTLELQIVKFKSGGGRRYASVFPKKLELTELKLNCVKGLHKYTNFWNAYSRGCKNLRHLSVTACPDIPPITTIMSQDNVKNIVLFSWPGLFDGMSVDEFMGHIGKLANCEDMERICDLPRLIEPMDVDDEDVIKMCKPMEALKVSFRWKLLEMFMTKWRERPMRFVPAVCTYVLPYQPYNQEARRLKVDALIRASEFSDALNECKLCEKWWGRDIYTRDLKLTCYIGLGNLVKVQKIIKRDLPKMVDVPLASRLDKHLWPPLEAIFRDYFQSSYQTQARERRNATLNTVMLHPSHMFQ